MRKIAGVVVGINSTFNTATGEWNHVVEHAQEAFVWDEKYNDGEKNFYQDIDEYIKWRSEVIGSCKRFFYPSLHLVT